MPASQPITPRRSRLHKNASQGAHVEREQVKRGLSFSFLSAYGKLRWSAGHSGAQENSSSLKKVRERFLGLISSCNAHTHNTHSPHTNVLCLLGGCSWVWLTHQHAVLYFFLFFAHSPVVHACMSCHLMLTPAVSKRHDRSSRL